MQTHARFSLQNYYKKINCANDLDKKINLLAYL